jgi:hypothetical protein
MSGSATVLGAHGQVHTLDFDSTTLTLAQQITNQINTGVLNGSIRPADNNEHPSVPGGHNEYVRTVDGSTSLPAYYDVVVLDTYSATIHGSTATAQMVIGGAVNAAYIDDKASASGAIVLGSGNDDVKIGTKNTGDWNINVGNGNDTINALGSGAHTVSAGYGQDYIRLGKGTDEVNVAGGATVVGGSGKETIFGAIARSLTFIGGSGDASVVGGQNGGNAFSAGSGNETLVGGTSGQDTFTFAKGHAGSADLIENFSSSDNVNLRSYSSKEITYALNHQTVGPSGVSITLADHSTITFANVTTLKPSSFH